MLPIDMFDLTNILYLSTIVFGIITMGNLKKTYIVHSPKPRQIVLEELRIPAEKV